MKKIIKNFGGAIFLYLVIAGMIVAINYRFSKLNEITEENQLAIYLAD